MSDGDDIRVQLARIEGKQDVANERLSNVQIDISEIRRVQHDHANRLATLEADKYQRDGERRGFALGGKLFLVLCGALPVGAGAVALRLLGA